MIYQLRLNFDSHLTTTGERRDDCCRDSVFVNCKYYLHFLFTSFAKAKTTTTHCINLHKSDGTSVSSFDDKINSVNADSCSNDRGTRDSPLSDRLIERSDCSKDKSSNQR